MNKKYLIIDRRINKVVGQAFSLSRAIASVNKRDNKYGACVHHWVHNPEFNK